MKLSDSEMISDFRINNKKNMVLLDIAQTCLFVRFRSIISKIRISSKKSTRYFQNFADFESLCTHVQLIHKKQIIRPIGFVIDAFVVPMVNNLGSPAP